MNNAQLLNLLRKIHSGDMKSASVVTPKDGKSAGDVASTMARELSKTASNENLDKVAKAISLMTEAAEILDKHSKFSQSDSVVRVMEKIASDAHTTGLTPARQTKNLKDHGTQFNLADDVSYLDMEVEDLKVDDSASDDHDFED
jgi:hypothetical protein